MACWDIYKNFPLLRGFLDTYFKETQEWLGEIFHAKFAEVMGCLLYMAWPLQFVYETLKQSEMFVMFLNGVLYPFF